MRRLRLRFKAMLDRVSVFCLISSIDFLRNLDSGAY